MLGILKPSAYALTSVVPLFTSYVFLAIFFSLPTVNVPCVPLLKITLTYPFLTGPVGSAITVGSVPFSSL